MIFMEKQEKNHYFLVETKRLIWNYAPRSHSYLIWNRSIQSVYIMRRIFKKKKKVFQVVTQAILKNK